MVPEVFSYIVNETLPEGRVPCNWTRTYDIAAEIQLCLESIRQFRMETVEEISIKIYVYDEMPALNFSASLLEAVANLKAVLDIDIVRIEKDIDKIDAKRPTG